MTSRPSAPLGIVALDLVVRAMTPRGLTPSVLRAAQRLESLPGSGLVHRLAAPVVGRRARGVVAHAISVEGGSGPLRARVHASAAWGAERPLVVYLHGGGWSLGTLDDGDWICSQLAAGLDAVVVSVDYRLAPRSPWPAAYDDAVAAAFDLASRATELGGDASRLVVAGDSSGGNLAAAVALAFRDAGAPLAAQALLYPALDLTLSSPSQRENRHGPVLRSQFVQDFRRSYVAESDPRDPRISPLLAADLVGVAPAVVQVGELDPLRDDGVRYAERLRAVGVTVHLDRYAATPHAFYSFPGLVPSARRAIDDLTAGIRRALENTRS